MLNETFDTLILGAVAAGMMCASHAAARGGRVLIVDHARNPGLGFPRPIGSVWISGSEMEVCASCLESNEVQHGWKAVGEKWEPVTWNV